MGSAAYGAWIATQNTNTNKQTPLTANQIFTQGCVNDGCRAAASNYANQYGYNALYIDGSLRDYSTYWTTPGQQLDWISFLSRPPTQQCRGLMIDFGPQNAMYSDEVLTYSDITHTPTTFPPNAKYDPFITTSYQQALYTTTPATQWNGMREYVTPVRIYIYINIHTSPTCTPTPISPITVQTEIYPSQTAFAYMFNNIVPPGGVEFPYFGIVR